jgi:maleylpyruvate isomerase
MEISPAEVVEAIAGRTDDLIAALAALDDVALRGPSLLPGWSRLTVACHLRYGARALTWMTDDTLVGRPTSYYPEGRAAQRPGTLDPDPGESPADVVASLAEHSGVLHGRWASLTPAQWRTDVVEPADNADLGTMPLHALALLHLTEVEVHGTDLDVGLAEWSELFVAAALPFRVERLARRRPANAAPGSWLLVATDGPSHLVTATPNTVDVAMASPDDPSSNADAPARIEGTSRDLLALLLGRPPLRPLRRAGDPALANAFESAFPGP